MSSARAQKTTREARVLPETELARPRTAQSFCVPKADLAAQGYDLSLNRYQEVVHAEVAHRPPGEILAALADLEKEIVLGMRDLETMLAKPNPAK